MNTAETYHVANPVQKMHDLAWRLVNDQCTEVCPTWSVGIQNAKTTTCSSLSI